jgi:hypothetical protein
MVCIDQLSRGKSPILKVHLSNRSGSSKGIQQMWQVKGVLHKFAIRSMLLAGATALLATVALVPAANAQISISINPPVCSYGYYDYSPYGCAPSGYYGPGYFYNGIFLGVGPWASWGYGHGWGEHRFGGAGGGRYVAGHRDEGFHGENHGRGRSVSASHHSESHERTSTTHAHASESHGRPSPSHAAPSHGAASHGASHAAAKHGNESHGGGDHH